MKKYKNIKKYKKNQNKLVTVKIIRKSSVPEKNVVLNNIYNKNGNFNEPNE